MLAQVEQSNVKFSMGWLFQATQAQFALAAEQGFFKAEGLDVTVASGTCWMAMGANLREQMLVKGQVDAITGFFTSAVPSLEALGRALSSTGSARKRE